VYAFICALKDLDINFSFPEKSTLLDKAFKKRVS
jgi:hypothetical protein